MWQLGLRGVRWGNIGSWRARVPVDVMVATRAVRARADWLGALPTTGQERKIFLLHSCLIRLIHILSLYREVYLTYKQDLLDP